MNTLEQIQNAHALYGVDSENFPLSGLLSRLNRASRKVSKNLIAKPLRASRYTGVYHVAPLGGWWSKTKRFASRQTKARLSTLIKADIPVYSQAAQAVRNVASDLEKRKAVPKFLRTRSAGERKSKPIPQVVEEIKEEAVTTAKNNKLLLIGVAGIAAFFLLRKK